MHVGPSTALSGKNKMAEIVFGEQALSAPMQQLVEVFKDDAYDGTFYIGYPILNNVEGTIRVDALYVSREYGVVVFETGHLDTTEDDDEAIDELGDLQNRYFAAVSSKLLESPELLRNRRLDVHVTIISISSNANFNHNDAIVSTVEAVDDHLPDDAKLSDEKFRVLNSVIERTATLRPVKKRTNVSHVGSRGSVLRKLEKNIANLDAWQKRAAIEMPAGVQRVRGLAGSGKTIVLALKAAFMHSRDPDARIVVTFQTRSLYQQFRRLVQQFCFEFSKEEPNWDRITIIHAWGSASSLGVYSEIARLVGQPAVDFASAKSMYGTSNAFSGICKSLLEAVKVMQKVPAIYDVVMIDEAQDFPQEFFELVYLVTKPPKRIVYAYDELQNLSDYSMMPAEDLFGRKGNGHPNVHLRNDPGKPKSDIILPICYRNTPWALTSAHGLGFGTAREQGLIQLFDEPNLWKEIGYDITSGELSPGRDVQLRRSEKATPKFFTDLITSDDAIEMRKFDDLQEELDWLASSIHKNLTTDELEYDDILIVIPQAITIRATAPRIMAALRKLNIKAHLVGVTSTRDAVFSSDSIAITSIYRAKGNEAPMVYVFGADYCFGGFNLARKRNVLFTAMTRSRAWLRVSGVGPEMDGLIDEFSAIKNAEYSIVFRYPTDAQLKQIRRLNRDRSSDELNEMRQDLEGLLRIMQRIDAGEISLGALPAEAQTLIRRLRNENPKPTNLHRKSN